MPPRRANDRGLADRKGIDMKQSTDTTPDLRDRYAKAAAEWALMYPISSWALREGEAAEGLAKIWGEQIARYLTKYVRDDEMEQLRYERRLLGAARMVLDLMAAGEPERQEQARQEAGDIAQRIVDEIGHPVTDEPALGPSYRAAIERVRALHRPEDRGAGIVCMGCTNEVSFVLYDRCKTLAALNI
jgi:hypothetical protein